MIELLASFCGATLLAKAPSIAALAVGTRMAEAPLDRTLAMAIGSTCSRWHGCRLMSGGRMERMIGLDLDRSADQLFDGPQRGALAGIAERKRDAVGAGAAGAADAVHVGFWFQRQIVVDHVANAVDVDAARSEVGGHEHTERSLAESQQGALARRLRFVAVNGVGRYAFTI